jgi:hypothetical protein
MVVLAFLAHQVNWLAGVHVLARSFAVLKQLGLITGHKCVLPLPETKPSLVALSKPEEVTRADLIAENEWYIGFEGYVVLRELESIYGEDDLISGFAFHGDFEGIVVDRDGIGVEALIEGFRLVDVAVDRFERLRWWDWWLPPRP